MRSLGRLGINANEIYLQLNCKSGNFPGEEVVSFVRRRLESKLRDERQERRNFMTLEFDVVSAGETVPQRAWADWAGMIASIGCAIHCAAMPLVFAYLPALGLSWLADEGFHRVMAIVCFGLAMAAFLPGWRKHRSFAPIVWGVLGLALLNTAAFALEGGCCSSCTSAATSCVDGDCAECQIAATPETSREAIAGFPVALLTPLGGILLVIGHVVNHHKNCRCQCCTEAAADDPKFEQP